MTKAGKISLLLADVDGTLVTRDKVLTPRAQDAVRSLREAGIRFAITSGRPPKGMAMLIEPLALETPIAGFNGGLFVRPDLSIMEERTLAPDVAAQTVDLILGHGLDVWIYAGNDWLVRDAKAPHVDREAWTVKFAPKVVDGFRRRSGQGGEDRRRQRRPRSRRALRGRRAGAPRRPGHRRPLATLLSRRDAPRCEQGFRCRLPVSSPRHPSSRDRHHRRSTQRCPDVPALRVSASPWAMRATR